MCLHGQAAAIVRDGEGLVAPSFLDVERATIQELDQSMPGSGIYGQDATTSNLRDSRHGPVAARAASARPGRAID